jgi:CheY-like chemotaxis protein/signal transduction histidine kinase
VAEGDKRSVLVVEDNPAALKLFRLALESEGYSVLSAFDARTALEQAAASLPDLVLQDLVLPDMDGLTLLRALRSLPNGKSIPIVAISGFKTLLDQAKDEPHGFDATLIKPVQPSTLVELVSNYLPLPVASDEGFGAGKSILVIDDDRIQLKLARLRLEHAGFSVRVASDGVSALEEAARQPPDVVLCDVLMPGTDGYELCQELRNVPGLEQVPVLLVSAYYGGPQDEQLARTVGARALVTRTPELEEVLEALRRVMTSAGGPGSVRRAPPEHVDLPKEQHAARVMAQLRRQAHANAGFAEKAELQSAQLSILAGIAAALLRSEDVEAAFGEVLSACLDAGGISRGALYRLEEGQPLTLTQAIGFPDSADEALELAFGCSERVSQAGHGVVVVIGGSASETASEREFFARAGLTNAVFIPFLEGERCIGALLLGSSTTELEARELTVFARAIGAHISQALALTESFSRLRDAAEAGRVLAASLDLDETLAALAQLATARLADVCEIELVGKEPCVYTAGRSCDPTLGYRIQQVRAAYPRLDAGASGDQVTPPRSVLVASITEERLQETAQNAEHLELLRGLGLKSEIIIPLLARGRLLGIVSFGRVLEGRAFTPRDLVAAEDLASRAAVAIDNASLYKIAQDASRMKDEFLATVSHELRTPLTAILGWARLLSGGLAAPKCEHAYQVIERNARAQAQLIEDLLDTSRIISGQMRLELKITDLTRIIDQAVESLKPTLELKNIQLRRVVPKIPIRIRADAARLQQIIWNLLFNAAKFTPSGGHVEIAVEQREAHVQVSVTDDGQGIEPEFLEFVFDRFKQAEGGITRAHGGLGLGLSITRHLAELHGGSISVHSEGKGRGAAFKVQFPLTPALVESTPPRAPEPRRRASHHSSEIADVAVLVVDDDDDARELMLEALLGYGARVSGAASVAEALAAVAQQRPDVLLSDIGMPGEDGYSLIRRIRTLAPCDGGTIPAAAITAYNRSEDRLLALDAGFQLHLAKPIDPSDLVATVVSLRRMAAGAKLA